MVWSQLQKRTHSACPVSCPQDDSCGLSIFIRKNQTYIFIVMRKILDCIIVGYNDVDLNSLISNVKAMERYSGAYRHMMQNVLSVGDKWISYMDCLNLILEKASGMDLSLHPMKMPNLAAWYLKSFLMQRDFTVEVVNFFNQEKEYLAELLQQNPLAIAVTTTFYVDHHPIQEIVRFVRARNPETKIIIGGPHIFNVCQSQNDITTQDFQLDKIDADIYINDYQGETTLCRVLKELKKGKKQCLIDVPNLIYPSNMEDQAALEREGQEEDDQTTYLRTPRELENNDMDKNVMDWRLVPKNVLGKTVLIRTARSCAFKCAFCTYPAVAGPLSLTCLDIVEKEMFLLHELGVKNLVFIDDTFNVPLPRFKSILRMMIKNGFRFNWFSFFRCSHSDDEALDLMKESGCKAVFLGIESGDETILSNMNKHASLEDYHRGIRGLKERGIITFASFVVGFPGETEVTIQNTIDLIERCRPTYYKVELYYHSDRAPVGKERDKYNLRGGGFSWLHATMDWRQACDWIYMMYKQIKGSTVFPLYMFDFWAIPYLYGKGLSLEQIDEFVKRCQPMLLENMDLDRVVKRQEPTLNAGLLSMAQDIAACQGFSD